MSDRKPPVAARKPVSTTLHGTTRQDEYAWLKDPDWQRVMRDPAVLDPEIRAYLEAENEYKDTFLAPWADLRAALYDEMRGRIAEDDSPVPAPDGDWLYYVRHVEGGEHPVHCRAPRHGGGAEEVLLDGNREAEGESYFRIAACRHSPDHRRLAYATDVNGSERYRIFVRDIGSGETVDGPVEDARGDVVWANDGATVFYTVIDDNHRPWQVRRHRIGDRGGDAVVYEESDPGFFVGIGKSESGRFVTVSAHDHTTSEVRLIDADKRKYAQIFLDYHAGQHPGLAGLTVDDLRLSRIQVTDPAPIPEHELQRTYEWMRSWNMLDDVGEQSLIDAKRQARAHDLLGA